MEVRVKDVIINIDRPVLEDDKRYLEHQAQLILSYFSASTTLRCIQHIMIAEVGVHLAKLSLLDGMVKEIGEDNGKSGGV